MELSNLQDIYKNYDIDLINEFDRLKEVPISLHCWQGDDVTGFDNDVPLTGGIQATGNYIGKATTPNQLMNDLDFALSMMPGKKKLNLHANYAIFENEKFVDRNLLQPIHFARWIEFAKKHNMGIDFNPTFFSHQNVENGLTLSSPNPEIRKFWVDHGISCLKIAEHFAKETGVPSVFNIWIGDGYKNEPVDKLSPRIRFRESLDEIFAVNYDKALVKPCIESKVFGIGVESYTVGSSEFCLSYAASRKGIIPLMDNGHYHPTEMVSDKISALLAFFPEIALHVTRPVRWDSDHVVVFDDETRAIATEIVRNNALHRVHIALDFFDASINRIAAWVIGYRSLQKALLYALTYPYKQYSNLQDSADFTKILIDTEKLKMLPFGLVWDKYCEYTNIPSDENIYSLISDYEERILKERK